MSEEGWGAGGGIKKDPFDAKKIMIVDQLK